MMFTNARRIFHSPEGRQLEHLLIETKVCEFPTQREVPIYLSSTVNEHFYSSEHLNGTCQPWTGHIQATYAIYCPHGKQKIEGKSSAFQKGSWNQWIEKDSRHKSNLGYLFGAGPRENKEQKRRPWVMGSALDRRGAIFPLKQGWFSWSPDFQKVYTQIAGQNLMGENTSSVFMTL